ncbi:type II 3-dehydroquinate dehydratase [Heyndrickxia sporothermodurans]|uniref:3-dehydroquinate dehydratase n=4 Tax=Heyndrickxia sporothermodurans TaxID=46224 RepID=A0AB37HRE7_9BACI|nr:type II 3-dehydroquinate dehydratase [Heyndrickxia sporothermodurans]MBL5766032.1 type II 3-dehydroquinate dehydratase [Heyndrickxia sporothermodurans]MBL5769473.1 type II 3-dehydroquinate dehydratase [Heyndrickxia sporothermodurans]MBL5773254.1 type II 3-dehydroquinate dehydratase [Heyndrickxia sporothermodurans]MBL5777114.1 type II 3-dehydroquinate dehydratase [Heyndrickxia sporothermodurans]MBL5780523.1 type II 3-dehydroquinate dehydratase [Heyndrickxia sporothermodurans]
MMKILLLNGPNLNLLGKREPDVYGKNSLKTLYERFSELEKEYNVEVVSMQSNHEGELIDKLHETNNGDFLGVIFNPGAFTHYSYAIRDAIASIDVPVIEVHISNVHNREEFRRVSVISPVTAGQIVGLGLFGYELALKALVEYIGKGE